jgi:hypothetical protein
MASYEAIKEHLLEDPQVKAAYDALQSEYDRIQAALDTEKGPTGKADGTCES